MMSSFASAGGVVTGGVVTGAGAGHRPVGPGLQVDGLVQDGQGVLVDVLVALVLVDGRDEAGDLGQDDLGNARVDHQLDAAARVLVLGNTEGGRRFRAAADSAQRLFKAACQLARQAVQALGDTRQVV